MTPKQRASMRAATVPRVTVLVQERMLLIGKGTGAEQVFELVAQLAAARVTEDLILDVLTRPTATAKPMPAASKDLEELAADVAAEVRTVLASLIEAERARR